VCLELSSVEGLPSDLKCLPRLRTGTDSGMAGSVKCSVFQGEQPQHSETWVQLGFQQDHRLSVLSLKNMGMVKWFFLDPQF